MNAKSRPEDFTAFQSMSPWNSDTSTPYVVAPCAHTLISDSDELVVSDALPHARTHAARTTAFAFMRAL